MPEPQSLQETGGNTKIISRRDFVKLSAVGLAVAAGLRGDTLISPERKLNSDVLVLDFFNVEKPTRENLFENIPKSDEEIKLLANDYYSQEFGDHGDKVYEVMKKTAELLGEDTRFQNITKVSIVNAVHFEEIEKDELGNPTVWVEIDEKYIDDQISMSPESVINMSFELGRIPIHTDFYWRKTTRGGNYTRDDDPQSGSVNGKVWYKDQYGNPITEEKYNELLNKGITFETVLSDPADRDIYHEDGYLGENTYDNLKKLTNIARNHPDKIFVAAGGNPSKETGKRPDIREARKKLEEEGLWINNLIMVGYTDEHPYGHQVEPMQLGCDYYINSELLRSMGFDGASSFATAHVTKLINHMIENGDNKMSLVKAKLDKFSTQQEVDITDTEAEIIKYKLLAYKNEQ